MALSRRTLLSASVAGVVLAACSRATPGSQLKAILDRACIDILREAPEACTGLALSEEQAGGRYMDRLSDASKEGLLRGRAVGERVLGELRGLKREDLSGQDGVTYDVVVTATENSLATSAFEVGGGAGAPYILTQLTGAYPAFPISSPASIKSPTASWRTPICRACQLMRGCSIRKRRGSARMSPRALFRRVSACSAAPMTALSIC